jgi:hypothetical protein
VGAELAAHALSRANFRVRVGRYAEDWRTDQAYNFFIFLMVQSEIREGKYGNYSPLVRGCRG